MSVCEVAVLALADHVRGAGRPLLLLHGGSGSHRHWVRVVEPMARAFEVHAPDLPGYGESPSAPAGTDADSYIALAAASLDALLPPGPVDVVGFSFGGVVAAAIARRWQQRVRRLTLIGPGGFGAPRGRNLGTRSRREAGGSDMARREIARHNLAAMMLADPTAIDDTAIDQQLWNLAHTRFNSPLLSYQDRVPADIAVLTCPLQLLWGARDTLPYPSLEHRIERVRAVRPDARVAVVPEAGHWVMYERPDAIVRLLLDFHAPPAAPTEE